MRTDRLSTFMLCAALALSIGGLVSGICALGLR